jgi:hypothetical protein
VEGTCRQGRGTLVTTDHLRGTLHVRHRLVATGNMVPWHRPGAESRKSRQASPFAGEAPRNCKHEPHHCPGDTQRMRHVLSK